MPNVDVANVVWSGGCCMLEDLEDKLAGVRCDSGVSLRCRTLQGSFGSVGSAGELLIAEEQMNE